MDSFQEEYSNKIRQTGKIRFAEMDGTTEGIEESMLPLPIASIDSFAYVMAMDKLSVTMYYCQQMGEIMHEEDT